MFSIAAGIFTLSLVLIAFMLPSVARVELPSENALSMQGGWQDSNVRMLFVASTLMWTCNTMYIIDMPLWISSDLGLPDKLAAPDGDGSWTGNTSNDSGWLLCQTLW